MAEVIQGRRGVGVDGDFVVFLIGACLDLKHPLRSLGDLGGRRRVHEALHYVAGRPEKGLVAYQVAGLTVTQHWRSLAHLAQFVGDDDPHLEGWRSYWARVARSSRTTIWHETYLVRSGEYTPVNWQLPAFGRSAGRVALDSPTQQVVGIPAAD